MLDGIPHWQPPPWHPTQQPQRNYLHNPELLTRRGGPPHEMIPDNGGG